jgi:hypothetical protein
MQPNDSLEKWIAGLKARPSQALDASVHAAIDTALAQQRARSHAAAFPFTLWRMLMKNPTAKWTAAAIAIAATFTGLLVLNMSAPAAFGFPQVIQASKNIRSLHVKEYHQAGQEPNEFWIKSDDAGQVVKARYFLPVTEDGAKLITWTPARAEVWFQSKKGYLLLRGNEIKPWMQSLLDQCQPQPIMEKLEKSQKEGKVTIETRNPADPSQPILILVTNLQPAPKEGAWSRQVFQIDPASHLIKSIERYATADGQEALRSRTEFCDYNVPIDDKMFSLREDLPKDVRIADKLTQTIGVPQGNRTDPEAAAETARQFFQALMAKDYKQAGLIMGGESEKDTRSEFGKLNVTAIVSIGPAVPQPQWLKRGFRVPCELEITSADGQKRSWKTGPYIRPGDDEANPDRWNITGGVEASQAGLPVLPAGSKYEKMTPKEAAQAFFDACARKDWTEVLKFWPTGDDERFERMKEGLGGLKLVSLGTPFQKGEYPGWFVPYEIQFPAQESFIRVSNTNAAKRFVIDGEYDSQMRPDEIKDWSTPPEILPDNDVYARMTPVETVQAYAAAFSKLDLAALGKFIPKSEVAKLEREVAEAKRHGVDVQKQLPHIEVGEATWSPQQGSYFVKCHMAGVSKKWNLAIRNDNSFNRYLFDGGL